MDKKLFDKSSNFFKKEGFYVVLFVCLCIVATVGALTLRNNKPAKQNTTVTQQDKKSTTNSVASTNPSEPKTEVPNALQVKGDSSKTQQQKSSSNEVNVPNKGSSSTVSKSNDFKFVKPVAGTLAKGYTTDLVFCKTIGTYKTDNGIEIKSDLNSPVYAALDGKVTTIDNDKTELGQYVVIDHQNGLKTIYSNLNEELKVKVGDSVKKGQQIGKVGNTRGSYSDETYGSHLHFEVMQGKKYVDPEKYVVYGKTTAQ